MKALPVFGRMPISSSKVIIESKFPGIDTPVKCHVLGNNYYHTSIHVNQIRADVYAVVTSVLAYRAKLFLKTTSSF